MADDLDGEPTETGRYRDAMLRLLPALDRAAAATPVPGYPAYRPPGAGLDEPLPEDGAGLDVVLDELEDVVDHGCAITSPGWLGFITTGGTTSSEVAQAAVAVAGGQRYLFHSFNHLEHLALRWLAELCGVPSGAAGVFTTGGSTANLLGLGAARQAAYERHGHDVAESGLGDLPIGRVYTSDHAHRTIHRSAAVLGLGRRGVVGVKTDGAGRIDVVALGQAIDRDRADGIVPVAVVAVAGTTDTGAVDPIADVIEVAKARDCWVHVDGAYGLVAHASPNLAPLFTGVKEADSWVVDPHKWLATGVGVGAVYVRDARALTRAFAEGHADYLEGSFGDDSTVVSQFDGFAGPWGDQGVELSSPPRGVLVWAVLREVGRRGIARRVERHVALARYLADSVRVHPRLELLCEPQLSIACFRYLPPGGADADELNRRVLEALRRTTTSVPTSTVVDGRFAIRPCFINPRNSRVDVDALLGHTVEIGDRLAAER